MARRPARCYRYCKNKVCLLFPKAYILTITVFARPLRRPHSYRVCFLQQEILLIPEFLPSHTLNLDSIVVFLILKFASSIWVAKKQMSTSSHFACTWSPMNTSNFLLKHSKLREYVPISPSQSTLHPPSTTFILFLNPLHTVY